MGSRFWLCYSVTAKSAALIVLPLYETLNVCSIKHCQLVLTTKNSNPFISPTLQCLWRQEASDSPRSWNHRLGTKLRSSAKAVYALNCRVQQIHFTIKTASSALWFSLLLV